MRSVVFFGWAAAFFVAGVLAALVKLVAIGGFFIAVAKFLVAVGIAISGVRALFTILGGNLNKDSA